MVTSFTKGWTQKLHMTIHWKALEQHFLMLPFNCSIQPFLEEKCIF
jgi:hypothetical protein